MTRGRQWLTGRSGHPYLCVPCRFVAKDMQTCPKCSQPAKEMHYSWRAPKAGNEKAWRLIEAGDYWWEGKPERRNDFTGDWLWRMRKVNPKYGQTHVEKRPGD